jgi:hypothetical protein
MTRFVDQQCGGDSDVERLDGGLHGDRHALVTGCDDLVGKPGTLAAHDQQHWARQIDETRVGAASHHCGHEMEALEIGPREHVGRGRRDGYR